MSAPGVHLHMFRRLPPPPLGIIRRLGIVGEVHAEVVGCRGL